MAGYPFFQKARCMWRGGSGVGGPRQPSWSKPRITFSSGRTTGAVLRARAGEDQVIRRLENEDYFRKPVSRTFHGRDIFAPVAAYLSRG